MTQRVTLNDLMRTVDLSEERILSAQMVYDHLVSPPKQKSGSEYQRVKIASDMFIRSSLRVFTGWKHVSLLFLSDTEMKAAIFAHDEKGALHAIGICSPTVGQCILWMTVASTYVVVQDGTLHTDEVYANARMSVTVHNLQGTEKDVGVSCVLHAYTIYQENVIRAFASIREYVRIFRQGGIARGVLLKRQSQLVAQRLAEIGLGNRMEEILAIAILRDEDTPLHLCSIFRLAQEEEEVVLSRWKDALEGNAAITLPPVLELEYCANMDRQGEVGGWIQTRKKICVPAREAAIEHIVRDITTQNANPHELIRIARDVNKFYRPLRNDRALWREIADKAVLADLNEHFENK